MHNFNSYKKESYTSALDDILFGTREEKRTYIDSQRNSLCSAHEEYDAKAETGTLNSLTSNLTRPGDEKDFPDHDYWKTFNLYGSNLRYIADHWKKLKELNGNMTLICPICGLEKCTDMDHFAPRSKFPEMSCHIGNLIPTCHDCNIAKGTKWIDDNNRQMIFNAFYDVEIPDKILEYSLVESADGDVMDVKVGISSSLSLTNPIQFRIVKTIEKLDLLPKFQDEASKQFNIRLSCILARYRCEHTKYSDIEAFLDSEKIVTEETIKSGSFNNFIDRDLFKVLTNDETFRNYVADLLSKELSDNLNES